MAQHIFTGSGKPTSAPTAVGQHYIDTTNGGHFISVGTSSVNDWKINAPSLTCFAFFNGETAAYITKVGDTYTTVAYLFFPGTDLGCNIREFKVVAGEVGTGEANARLYDATNAQQIAEVDSVSGLSIIPYSTTTITNLPAAGAIFEVQVKHDAAAGSIFLANIHIGG